MSRRLADVENQNRVGALREMGWIEFVVAFGGFYVLHSVPLRPPVRSWLVARLGRPAFAAAYSVLSLVMLAGLFAAVDRAPYVLLWSEPPGGHWLVLIAMTTAGLLLAFGLFRPNPLSFGGRRNAEFDPRNAGILRWVRHPVLAAFFLWSSAHLVVNGDLAHVLLFGSFAGFALLGMRIIDRRRRREMSSVEWRRTVTQMRNAPVSLPHAVLWRSFGALAALATLLLLHPWFAGVDVLWRFLP